MERQDCLLEGGSVGIMFGLLGELIFDENCRFGIYEFKFQVVSHV